MKVSLLPSCIGSGEALQFLTAYRVNEEIAVDAGSLGLFCHLQEQERVHHVLLTHTHMDHIASLPIFVENVYRGQQDCVQIYGTAEVLDCLRKDLFNDRLWPDFIRLSKPEAPFLRLIPFRAGEPLDLPKLRVTPIALNHVVPTCAFVLEDDNATVIIATDTGPTEEIWAVANSRPNLKAVFLEACFPDEMTWLADVSGHLTPAQFAREVAKLKQPVPVLAVHLKARHRDQVTKELKALGLPQVEVCQPGKVYSF